MVEEDDTKRIYPCAGCGKLLSKNEGGTVFAVCEECWDKHYHKKPKSKEKSVVPIEQTIACPATNAPKPDEEARPIDCKNECIRYQKCYPFINPVRCTMKEPKPADRLLTDEELDIASASPDYIALLINQGIQNAIKAQDTKAASILEAQCQARVDRIFTILDDYSDLDYWSLCDKYGLDKKTTVGMRLTEIIEQALKAEVKE